METHTGSGGTRGDVSDLVVILCGEKGESSPLPLKSSDRKPFQANQRDICQVCTGPEVTCWLRINFQSLVFIVAGLEVFHQYL